MISDFLVGWSHTGNAMKNPIALFSLLSLGLLARASNIPCSTTTECETILRGGSECHEGSCTNPFHRGGCLRSHNVDIPRVRVCGSADPPEAVELGYCREPQFDYMEVRLLWQDWESAFFSTWILQILLSELLQVPVSVEGGKGAMGGDFYNRELELEYSEGLYNYEELSAGAEVKDCRDLQGSDDYTPCAHVVSESWVPTSEVTQAAEPQVDLGALGRKSWYIPLYTAERDPTLVSHVGLRGERNRRKLAERFKRPTTWKQYCDEVSPNGCESDDGVASRAPLEDELEEGSFFVEGLFTGHFRFTAENDCDQFPEECTGHIADFPCSWHSYAVQQTHHLGISLASSAESSPNNGYSYTALTQIWAAANATKSDVMIVWWSPEALLEAYVGTDAEFTPVVLPTPTQECIRNRANTSTFCEGDLEAMIGDPTGVCDYTAQPLKKAISKNFREHTMGSGVPEALKSPAYNAFRNFQISDLQYGEIFQELYKRDTDYSFDLRDATCQWVADNIDLVRSFIPETHPRDIEEEELSRDVLISVAYSFSGISVLLVLVASLGTFMKRSTKSIYYAQLECLSLILCGQLLVALSSLISPMPPTDTTCVSTVWLSNIGIVIQLIPVALRVDAINKLANSGKQMQRVHIRSKTLVRSVTVASTAIVGLLLAWTLLDAPKETIHYELTQGTNQNGDTLVVASDYCDHESPFWAFIGLGWQALVLVPLIVLAYVASRVNEDLNDTSSLGVFLGVHLAFLIARACLVGFLDGDQQSDAMLFGSLALSSNTIIGLCVYLLPKLIDSGEAMATEILPDLFLNTTIMLADIEGFAAWSSAREPLQVFKFLESLFEAFDTLAEKHKVFKVETTGECYVAAAGIPEYRADHATIMAKFASDCMTKSRVLTKRLEVQFGPDTSDMTLRVGIHSGAVTGGFMRGKQTRFQLFGDTMTTTGLIQTTGEGNQVHMSETTANLLIEAGRKRWVEKRDVKVQTAEKGELQTYWLTRHRRRRQESGDNSESHPSYNTTSNSDASEDRDELLEVESEDLWIKWNVEVLRSLLKSIAARRNGQSTRSSARCNHSHKSTMPLEEVKEVIELPPFDKDAARRQREYKDQVELPEVVVDQLRTFVTHLAGMYEANPFHNFAHASYVVMAVTKFMNRIVAASEVDVGYDEDHQRGRTLEAIHDHTYGITSDPLTQFACVFSALIHDVDHPGVPNGQLIKENVRVASIYQNRSVAEQKSFDMAWDLLCEAEFDELRSAICSTQAEIDRLRQLIINSVMATDLGDPELKALRNNRWSKAFDNNTTTSGDTRYCINRKATIVIEHLIQAADVAHTCQHWGIYQKWNQRLFEECYLAYHNGRAEKNPADDWYEGEIGFFDFYIIPLSKKLRDCGVFGSTSDENLNYAKNNREIWVKEGKRIVAEMLHRVKSSHGTAAEKGSAGTVSTDK